MTLRLILLAAALFTTGARADATAPDTKEQASLQSFAAGHPACQEWSDGCAVCKRDGEAAHCSLPGPACQPQAVTCK
jgi:hypothetical protein